MTHDNFAKKICLVLILCAFTLSSRCFSKRHGPEDFYFGDYSEAEIYYARGQYDRAIQKYQSYIDENPEGNLAIIAQYYIAKSHAALGHDDAARELFNKIVSSNPDLVWANFSETQIKEMEKAKAEADAAAAKASEGKV